MKTYHLKARVKREGMPTYMLIIKAPDHQAARVLAAQLAMSESDHKAFLCSISTSCIEAPEK